MYVAKIEKRMQYFCFAGLVFVGHSCAHADTRIIAVREDRDAAIVRRWSRNEATAEEVQQVLRRFESLPDEPKSEALQALMTVGQPRHVDAAFFCSGDAGSPAPLQCAHNTGGDQLGQQIQFGFDCWYVANGNRCSAAILSCIRLGSGDDGIVCDDHEVCFTAEPDGLSIRSAQGVRLVRAENLPAIPESFRCRSSLP